MDFSTFSFTKRENPAPTGGENQASNLASDSGLASSAARDAAKAELESTARRRGRPRKDATVGGTNQPTVSPELAAELQRQLEALYDPRAWASLLSLPDDVALAFTGNEKRWNISSDERATLGATGSAAARTLMITNPRSLALLMCSSALLSVYMPRAMQELKDYKVRQAEKQRDEKTKQ